VEGLRSCGGETRGDGGQAMLTGVGILVLELRDGVRSWRGPWRESVDGTSGCWQVSILLYAKSGKSVSKFSGEA
jgi:hypothetical protein